MPLPLTKIFWQRLKGSEPSLLISTVKRQPKRVTPDSRGCFPQGLTAQKSQPNPHSPPNPKGDSLTLPQAHLDRASDPHRVFANPMPPDPPQGRGLQRAHQGAPQEEAQGHPKGQGAAPQAQVPTQPQQFTKSHNTHQCHLQE